MKHNKMKRLFIILFFSLFAFLICAQALGYDNIPIKEEITEKNRIMSFRLGEPRTILSNRKTDNQNVGDPVDAAIIYGCACTIREGLYYLYYEGQFRSNLLNNDGYSPHLAWSEDGEHWNKGYPTGVEPVDSGHPGLGVLFEVGNDYRTEIYLASETETKKRYCIGVLEQKNRTREFTEFSVIKVNDSAKPFRMIGNKSIDYVLIEVDSDVELSDIESQVRAIIAGIPDNTKAGGEFNLFKLLATYYKNVRVNTWTDHYKKMCMFKSSDGIHWGDYDDDAIEVSDLAYDTQYSAILYGDVIKVYARNWDYNQPVAYRRSIGVMTIDIEGHIISPNTKLFGEGMYNPAAFKIDERRDLLLPTFFDTEHDASKYCAFIVDDKSIYLSSDIDEMLRANHDLTDASHEWGMVCPGFLFIDGDVYFTYCHINKSHDGTHMPDGPIRTEIRIVQLKWNQTGTGNVYLSKP